MKEYTFKNMVFDMVMLVVTGGAWILWVIVRYLRTH